MRSILWNGLAGFLLVGCTLLSVSVARADDRYYVMIFAAEGRPNIPRSAHSFAMFINVQAQEDVDAENWPIDAHTISWLPATLDVRMYLQPPEQGVNLDMQSTLNLLASRNAGVSAWGPFEIQKELYDRALGQIERLNSGAVAYKAMDLRFRPNVATNCFHAISDIVDGPLLNTGTAFGVPASRMVVHHLAPWYIEPQTIHRHLVNRLGLEGYSILYRSEVPAIVSSE